MRMPKSESRDHSGLVELNNIQDIAFLKKPGVAPFIEKTGLNIEELEALQKSDPVKLYEKINEPVNIIRDHIESIENLLKEIKEDIGEKKAA